jgi:LysM repeat protein
MRTVAMIFAALALLLAPALLGAKSTEKSDVRVHTVYRGQRLGSIAKRYNVTVGALCHANGISRSKPIRPGQKLIVPARDDEDGSAARELRLAGFLDDDHKGGEDSVKEARVAHDRPHQKPRWHTVYRGQRLGSIAKRYNVTVGAICHANDLSRSQTIFPGQKLVIPGGDDPSGSHARSVRLGHHDSKRHADGPVRSGSKGSPSWRLYEKPPWRRGYVRLVGHTEEWKGYVIGPGNRVLSGARRAVSRVLTAPRNRRLVDSRLVRLIATVSDTFGGRPLRVVSGYRTSSYVKGSRHKVGRAVDFRIVGVPNAALRDYLRTLRDVGVGYYPNSTFVHLDVRKRSAYWVDYAGPGEPPRYRRATRQAESHSGAGDG